MSIAPPEPTPTRAAPRWVPWLIAGCLLPIFLLPIIYALIQSAANTDRLRLEFARLEVDAGAQPLPAEFLEEVRRLGGLPQVLELREAGLPGRLTQAFGRHPWVESVERVAILPRGRVAVRLTPRRPVAVVQVGTKGSTVLVDRHGIALARGDAPSELPRIITADEPLGQPGHRYGVAEVELAAQTAAVLHADRDQLGITTLVISRDQLAPELRLRTHGGTTIIWQSLKASGREAEPSPEEKLRRLHAYVANYGSLDKPSGPYLLDVRSPAGLLREPLPAE
jgi:hypothetical protein